MFEIASVLGWVFTSLFIIVPLFVFGGIFLTRNKAEKKTAAEQAANATEGSDTSKKAFTKLGSKKPGHKDLIVKPAAQAKKSDQAAGVFGFGKSDAFTLPPQGEMVGSEKEAKPVSNSPRPSTPLPPHGATGRTLPPPPPSFK